MKPAKMFEVRDAATFIPVLAQPMASNNAQEQYLLRRAGYDGRYTLVLLTHLSSGRSEYDHVHWGDRTMANAHQYIEEHWDVLEAGQVIDVQVILGETITPRLSERITDGG